jgi:hypothetical protein
MALQTRVELSNGLVLENAFVKVLTINGSKNYMGITVQVYLTREKYEEGKEAVSGGIYAFNCSCEESEGNHFAQAYRYLKTLPQYKDAVDV